MNKIIALRLTKLIAYAAGGGLSGVFAYQTHTPAGYGVALMAIAGALGVLFPSPAQAVVVGAPEVTPGGLPTGATNTTHT